MNTPMIEFLYLGRVDYDEALRLQAEITSMVAAALARNVLLLLEHPPVLTLGRTAHRATRNIPDPARSKLLYNGSRAIAASAQLLRRKRCTT